MTVHATAAAHLAVTKQPTAPPRQPTATKQQQHAKITLHKNRRQKTPMQVPSEEPVRQVHPLAQYAGCR